MGVIFSFPSFKVGNAWFTTVPLKALSDQDKSNFIFLKTNCFHVWFLHKIDLRISTTGKISELLESNTFKPRKTIISYRLFVK